MKNQNQPMTEGQFRKFMATSKKREAEKWLWASVLVFFAGFALPQVITVPAAIGLCWWSYQIKGKALNFEIDQLWEAEKHEWGF